jgi:LytS/YehU family sensor histidine kinase
MVVATCLLLIQRHFTLRDKALVTSPLKWFARQALWVPTYWIAFTPLAFGIRNAVYALAGQTYDHAPWPHLFVYESIKISIFIGLFTVIRFGILSWRELLEAKLRAEQANTLLHQAQLQRLAQQMQPHFLFNALNTVSSLMHTDVARADATLVQLAGVLRATLDLGASHETPLATELHIARGYAAVMGERFEGRVAIDWEVDEALLACRLPTMSLQPLLENVFKHTVERRRGATRIQVRARRDGQVLCVAVEDDSGQLGADTPAGIGIANLRARLEALHGGGASFALTQLAPAGVRAEMRLPCAC